MSSSNVYTHSGVSMVVECVMKDSKPRSEAESRRPECVKRDFSSFFSQMNEKNCYVGIEIQLLCLFFCSNLIFTQLTCVDVCVCYACATTTASPSKVQKGRDQTRQQQKEKCQSRGQNSVGLLKSTYP